MPNVTFSLDSRWIRNKYPGFISFGNESARVRFVGGGLRLDSRKIIGPDTDIKVWEMFELMPAALRQLDRTGFASKITKLIVPPSYWAVVRAQKRYLKFMGLMKEKGMWVPTLDINLVWHTHQLSTDSYDAFCEQNVGRRIDHDDTIAKSTLSDGLKRTELEWMIHYQEEYLEKSAFTEQHRSEVLKQAAAYQQAQLRLEKEIQKINTKIERLVNEFKETEQGRLAKEQDLQRRLDELEGQRKSFEDSALVWKKNHYFAHPFRFLPRVNTIASFWPK